VVLNRASSTGPGVVIGDTAELADGACAVIGTTYLVYGRLARSMFITSNATAALVDPQLRRGDDVAYLLVKLRPDADPERVRDHLNVESGTPPV